MQAVHWRALYRDAQRDERIVYRTAAVSQRVLVPRAGNFEMSEVDELGEGRYESRNVGRSMEEWWVLLDKKVGHIPGAVFCRLLTSADTLGCLKLRFIEELFFLARLRVDDGREEGLRAMGHMESKRLDMAAYPRERLDACRLGKGRRLECNGEGFEQERGSACRKVMADKTEVGRIFVVKMG